MAAWRLSQAVLWLWCGVAAILLALMALCTVAWPLVAAWGFLHGDEGLCERLVENFPVWIVCVIFTVGVVTAWSRREKVT